MGASNIGPAKTGAAGPVPPALQWVCLHPVVFTNHPLTDCSCCLRIVHTFHRSSVPLTDCPSCLQIICATYGSVYNLWIIYTLYIWTIRIMEGLFICAAYRSFVSLMDYLYRLLIKCAVYRLSVLLGDHLCHLQDIRLHNSNSFPLWFPL